MTTLLLFISIVFGQKSYEEIHTFNDKVGHTIGSLEGVKTHSGLYSHLRFFDSKGDIVYRIEKGIFYEGESLDLQITSGGFFGYRIELLKPDYVVITYLSNGGKNVADSLTIEYDYTKKRFFRVILP